LAPAELKPVRALKLPDLGFHNRLKKLSVAYPVLDAAGELAALRSRESDVTALPAPATGR
jgi:hypothetical protein